MTAATLVLAMLAVPECTISKAQLDRIAPIIITAEDRYNLPRGLLAAVILAESGGKNQHVRGVGKGRRGCDTGPAQIHVPGCKRRKVRQLRNIERNIFKGAQMLATSREECAEHRGRLGCRRSIYGRYNPRSPTWWGRVEPIWMQIQERMLWDRI